MNNSTVWSDIIIKLLFTQVQISFQTSIKHRQMKLINGHHLLNKPSGS